ncbi:hypothetical protein BLGI_4632 [Brevibacillus laterosporus GI-9]|nr:hypothetical protein BLGI_4632 [Brevibacillus laterosporus GI-9]
MTNVVKVRKRDEKQKTGSLIGSCLSYRCYESISDLVSE